MSVLAFQPFLQPLPIWNQWYVLLLPLCMAIATVYKSIKCRTMAQVPKEAAILIAWIFAAFFLAAAVLMLLVRWLAN